MVRARYIYDNKSKQYLEGMAGLWCTALGYGNEEIIETATCQMRELSFGHMFGGKTHPAAMELADKLAAHGTHGRCPGFLESGSDANDTLVKLVRYYAEASGQPQRTKIIAREKGYHGVTVASASLTGLAPNHAHFQLPFDALGVLRTGAPHYYRCAEPGESEADFVARRARELEALILAEGPDTIAAMIAEPVNGAGGVIIPPEGYFEAITAVLDRYGIVLWDDEVICGFGRLGTAFGADRYQLKPQMMACAKALSSAYVPVSAAIVAGDIVDAIAGPADELGVFGHGYTYSGTGLWVVRLPARYSTFTSGTVVEHSASKN
jgi:Adenosylmethionine-8-amino-7-oxononanoate aminotransferase